MKNIKRYIVIQSKKMLKFIELFPNFANGFE